MEIRFSESFVGSPALKPMALVAMVARAARQDRGDPGGGYQAHITNARGRQVRFTMPDADTIAHDRVIRALLTLDPDATVRTAKAIYNGKADFERQRGKP